MSEIYGFKPLGIDGTAVDFSIYKGKTLLIVNVASQCGFTKQYVGLEALYRQYKDRGLVVLGFPCNQFGAQEPGDETEIKNFCSLTYEVTFPLFKKVDVNGANTDPLFAYLKKAEKGILGTEAIKWNFTKFLVNKNGEVVKRYAPATTPEGISNEIADIL